MCIGQGIHWKQAGGFLPALMAHASRQKHSGTESAEQQEAPRLFVPTPDGEHTPSPFKRILLAVLVHDKHALEIIPTCIFDAVGVMTSICQQGRFDNPKTMR